MRITNNMLINNMIGYINNNLVRMDRFQTQLATGKKISVPSDDPIVASKALKLRTDVDEVAQFKRNSDDAYSWMDITENSLGMLVDVLQDTRQLSVQAASETLTPGDREMIKQEITQLRAQIIQIANTTYAGRYIYSGYATDSAFMNADGTYNVSVSSNETAVIKSGLIDLSAAAIDNTSGTLTFSICLDGTNYHTINLPAKDYDGTTNTLDDLANDIQAEITAFAELQDIKVKNENGRLQFSLKNTTDANGNRVKIYLKSGTPADLLQSIKVKTDAVTGVVISKNEDMRYQVGVGDNLNINVLGSQLFGSGVKGDMGDLILSFDRFIDSLSRTDQRSYINGQTIAANADNPLNLTNNNVFNIKVDGMAAYTTITIPDPGGYIYDGTPGKTLDDMVAGIQALIDADADLAAANVKVENKDGKITFSANNGRTITISDGPSNNNALEALKIYTDIDKTIVSKTGYEGIKSSITKMEELRDRVMSIRADIGARMNRIELTLNRLENDNINFISLMSKNEEVDMAETIMNLKNEENVYKASLSGGARIIMPTLVDFLR